MNNHSNAINAKITGINEIRQAPVTVVNHPHFYIHIEPKDYKGEYGFDYMRPEYILPIKNVLHSDNNERKGAFCQTIPELETVYQPVRFFENQPTYDQYYSPWIALLPNSAEYKLKLQKDVLSGVFPLKPQIEFRCSSPNIEINRQKLNNIKNPVRVEYSDNKEFSIRCVGEIPDDNLAIELFARLPSDRYPNVQPFQVGRMFIQPNNNRRSQDILFVHAVFSKNCEKALLRKYDRTGNNALQQCLNEEAFNQALFSCPIIAYESFDIRELPGGVEFIKRYELNNKIRKMDEKGNVETQNASANNTVGAKKVYKNVTTNNIHEGNYGDFRSDLFNLFVLSSVWRRYEDQINNGTLKFVILIDVAVMNCINKPEVRFVNSGAYTTGEARLNGSYALIQCESLTKGFSFNSTIIHEIGHLLGLSHPWERTPRFYQGYTNSYMDYDHNGKEKTGYYKKPLIFMKPDWESLRNEVVQ